MRGQLLSKHDAAADAQIYRDETPGTPRHLAPLGQLGRVDSPRRSAALRVTRGAIDGWRMHGDTRRMHARVLPMPMLIFALPALAAAADAPVIKAAPFEMQVVAAETATSFPAYTGSGAAIKAPDGPMGGVVVARDAEGKTSNYLRATITAEQGRTLVKVAVTAKNTGKAAAALKLGDVKVAAPGAVLMAIGEGTHAFTKEEAALASIAASTRQVPAGDALPLIYIYSLKTEDAPGKLTYKGKPGVDLKTIAQPAQQPAPPG